MWGPGIVKNPGRVSDEILTTMDFLPTFAAMAGINHKPEKVIDGKDATDLITGKRGAKSPWSHFYYYFGTELHAVREKQFKFRAKNILHNEDIYRRDEFSQTVPIPAALYDLNQDASEQKSVLKERADLQKRLETLLEKQRPVFGDALTNVKGRENREPGFSENPVNPNGK
jgi:arylsulfatase A-like enzyme